MRYRTKRYYVDAVQFRPDTRKHVLRFLGLPDDQSFETTLEIKDGKGDITAILELYDWVMRTPDGRAHAVPNNTFKGFYEPVKL